MLCRLVAELGYLGDAVSRRARPLLSSVHLSFDRIRNSSFLLVVFYRDEIAGNILLDCRGNLAFSQL